MQLNAPTPAYKHDAFISYSRRNEAFVSKLELALERYKPPKEIKTSQRYLDIFRDKEDFAAGDYDKNLEKHLKDSAKLIVVCSPEARKSAYVNAEILRFAQFRGADNIIPILFSGIPNNEAGPEDEEEKAFPEALSQVMKIPLAADYRHFDLEKDKVDKGMFSYPWYTTLAKIFDVSRSVIEQRERKRKARRLKVISASASASAAILFALLIWALASRQQAIMATAQAEASARDANQQRTEAEKERDRAIKSEKEAFSAV